MRLICPNCGAQYAVADDAIPSGGRDVQCSNCQHTWFETPGASATDMPPAQRAPAPPPQPKPQPVVPPVPDADRFSGSITDAFRDVVDDEKLAPAPQPPKNRKRVDPSVADILREEAALEVAQRKSETPAPMESQSDLGLSDPAPIPTAPPPAAPEPKLDSVPPVAAVASTAATMAAAAQASRRELLPDIEEINSSLRSDAERVEDGTASPAVAAEANQKSFRRGFVTVLLIIMIFVLIYVQADKISAAVPALDAPLQGYVNGVNAARIWLDDSMQTMLTSAD